MKLGECTLDDFITMLGISCSPFVPFRHWFQLLVCLGKDTGGCFDHGKKGMKALFDSRKGLGNLH